MRDLVYTDLVGRNFLVQVPDDAPDEDARYGIPVGPPVLEALGLPLEIEVRLHNELFARKLYSLRDLMKRRSDVVSALQHALSVDVERIMEVYNNE